MTGGYLFKKDGFLFKHHISENLQKNAYSMHSHNVYELLYFLDGDATHVIENRKYKLKKGDLILIRPYQYHFIQIDSTSRYERFGALFDTEKHKIEGVDLIPEDIEIINIDGNAIAKDIFHKCDIYQKNCSEELLAPILSHLLSELFFSLHTFPTSKSKESTSLSPLISKALQYINENICTICDMQEIADHLFISESYLFRQFKKELHQTPKKYILEKRLLMAQKMLSDGEKPTEVSLKCGFSDYTTFYRNYTDFFGYSPKETALNVFS